MRRRRTGSRIGSALLFATQLLVFACLPLLHAPPAPSEPQPAMHADGAATDSHADCLFCRIAQTRFSPESGRLLAFAERHSPTPTTAVATTGGPVAPPFDIAAAPRAPPRAV